MSTCYQSDVGRNVYTFIVGLTLDVPGGVQEFYGTTTGYVGVSNDVFQMSESGTTPQSALERRERSGR